MTKSYKWIMSGLIVVACIFGVGLLATKLPEKEPAAESAEAFQVPDLPVDDAAAETIYKSSCLSCHGDQLQGQIGPALSKVGAELSKEKIYKQIQNGGGGMPPFKGKLTDDQLVTVTNWLAAKK